MLKAFVNSNKPVKRKVLSKYLEVKKHNTRKYPQTPKCNVLYYF